MGPKCPTLPSKPQTEEWGTPAAVPRVRFVPAPPARILDGAGFRARLRHPPASDLCPRHPPNGMPPAAEIHLRSDSAEMTLVRESALDAPHRSSVVLVEQLEWPVVPFLQTELSKCRDLHRLIRS